MKKTIAVVMAVVMLIGMVGILAGCGDKAPAEDNAGKLTVAVVVAGKFGDRSFYDSSKEGLDRLVADHGVNPVTIECNNETHDIQMKNAAENADVVVCVGWEFYNIETIAPDYPDVKWIWIDNATCAPVENILNITYA